MKTKITSSEFWTLVGIEIGDSPWPVSIRDAAFDVAKHIEVSFDEWSSEMEFLEKILAWSGEPREHQIWHPLESYEWQLLAVAFLIVIRDQELESIT